MSNMLTSTPQIQLGDHLVEAPLLQPEFCAICQNELQPGTRVIYHVASTGNHILSCVEPCWTLLHETFRQHNNIYPCPICREICSLYPNQSPVQQPQPRHSPPTPLNPQLTLTVPEDEPPSPPIFLYPYLLRVTSSSLSSLGSPAHPLPHLMRILSPPYQ